MPTARTDNLRNKVARQDTAPARQGSPTIAQLIEKQKPAIEAALKGLPLDPERFTRIVLTEVRRAQKKDGTNPLLQADPMSLLGAVMVSAQLGLEPGPLGEVYFVPYGREVTLIIGYKGFVKLARNSGQIKSLVARTVFANDEFDFSYGLDETLVHKPTLDDPGEAIAYYAVAKYKDGGHTVMVMSKAQVIAHRNKYAQGYDRKDSPWKTEFDAMGQKTLIRQMSKWLPMSTKMAEALAIDEKPAPVDLSMTVEDHAIEQQQLEQGDDEALDVGGQPEQEPEPEPEPEPEQDPLRAALNTANDDRTPTKGQTGKLEALLGERGLDGDVLRHAAFDVAYGVTSRNDLSRGQVGALLDVLDDEALSRALLEAANDLLVKQEADAEQEQS